MKKYYAFRGTALTYKDYVALKQIAKDRGHSLSRVIRAAIRYYLEALGRR